MRKRLLFVVNAGWFFISHRLPIAIAAREAGYDVHVFAALDPTLDQNTAKTLDAVGFSLHEAAFSRSGSHPRELLRDLRALWRLLRDLKPEVVHLVTLKPILLGGVAAKLAGVRRVVLAVPGRGSVFSSRGLRAAVRRGLSLLAYRIAYRRGANKVIIQNADDRDYFVSRGIFAQEDTRLIRGSGVELAAFHVADEPASFPVVVLASRMLREKGIKDFVDAANILRLRGVNARFKLVGEPDTGNPHTHTAEELRAWAHGGAVDWVGFRADMAVVFAQSHIVCLPTYYGEGVPKVLIEAAAAGKPIVTTDTPGCRDIVRHGYNGLLVTPRRPDLLANALAELIDDKEKRLAMGRKGRELVEQEFKIEIVVQQTLDVYKELLAVDES
ncbi:MAG TPA: glycosyltransferase family 4 protein [Steroidobacteraceae bacterium]|jgi:glycosyltransferase involved in cell wall biosynthesis|nr:glycosyltransferase family 4 protein [Steroidobacteraceae bacterium]